MYVPPRRLASALAVTACLLGARAALAQDEDNAKWDVIADIDGDGILDRASVVDSADGETIDLHIFLRSGNTKPPADVTPDIVKNAITSGTVLAFDSREKGTLTLTACLGCTSMQALDETLTVVYREGTLMVGGFTRGWELSHRLADGNVDVTMGSCSIDFLTGEGRASEGSEPDEETPVQERFKPITLADWSEAAYPDICKFKGEE